MARKTTPSAEKRDKTSAARATSSAAAEAQETSEANAPKTAAQLKAPKAASAAKGVIAVKTGTSPAAISPPPPRPTTRISERPAQPTASAQTPSKFPATATPIRAGMRGAGPQREERVAMRAYLKWLERGRPIGDDKRDWFDAEAEEREVEIA